MNSSLRYKTLLVAFPFGLIALGIVSLLLYEQRRLDQSELEPMSDQLTVTGLRSKYDKIRDFMTPRGFQDAEQLRHAKRVTSFIEGSLSPQNIGMQLSSQKALSAEGLLWKRYAITFKGRRSEPVVYQVGYLNSPDAVLAAALELAESLPRADLKQTVRFEFVPVKDQPAQGQIEALFSPIDLTPKTGDPEPLIQWAVVKDGLARLRASHL